MFVLVAGASALIPRPVQNGSVQVAARGCAAEAPELRATPHICRSGRSTKQPRAAPDDHDGAILVLPLAVSLTRLPLRVPSPRAPHHSSSCNMAY